MSPLARSKSKGPPDLAIILGNHKAGSEEPDEDGDADDAKRDAVEALAEGLGLEPKDIDIEKVLQALKDLHDLHTDEEDDADEDEEEES